MGFGFNLIGFPILILATVVLFFYSLYAESKTALVIMYAMWGFTILMFIFGLIADHYRTPIRLTKQDIIGEYRIDTTFFPGRNARWQYDHYRFYITDKDSIEFVVYGNDAPYQFYTYRINYVEGPPVLWSAQADTLHHVIQYQPILYRGYNKFYYVFHSEKYGNMFFRKLR